MRRVTRKRYLGLFSGDAVRAIEAHMAEPGTTATVCYENLAMDSSQHGKRSHLPVGPQWLTLKTLDDTGAMQGDLGRPLGETPSSFQYPTYYWLKPVVNEDTQWEAYQDMWDETHPVLPPVPRDDEGADRFTEARLAAWRGRNQDSTKGK